MVCNKLESSHPLNLTLVIPGTINGDLQEYPRVAFWIFNCKLLMITWHFPLHTCHCGPESSRNSGMALLTLNYLLHWMIIIYVLFICVALGLNKVMPELFWQNKLKIWHGNFRFALSLSSLSRLYTRLMFSPSFPFVLVSCKKVEPNISEVSAILLLSPILKDQKKSKQKDKHDPLILCSKFDLLKFAIQRFNHSSS